MENKLFELINPRLKNLYKTHIFYCFGKNKHVGHNFININSGTIIICAIWGKYDIREVEILPEYQVLIDKQMKKKSTKRYIELYNR